MPVRISPRQKLGSGKLLRMAFRGDMGSGKSTAVARLIEVFGGVEFAFAAPLYAILHYAQDICGAPRAKDRLFLQFVGTEWGRARNQNVWLNLMMENIKTHADTNIYISDMRFPNENDFSRIHDFATVQIVRPNSESARQVVGNGTLTHASETALNGIAMQYTISNDSTFDVYHGQVEALATLLLDKPVRQPMWSGSLA
jgi:hypothetical protein